MTLVHDASGRGWFLLSGCKRSSLWVCVFLVFSGLLVMCKTVDAFMLTRTENKGTINMCVMEWKVSYSTELIITHL